MSEISAEAVEGRLMAQRKLLGLILARLSAGEGARVLGDLEDKDSFQDSEEDPGAVPSEAFAIEAAMADERRLIVEEARRLMAGDAR